MRQTLIVSALVLGIFTVASPPASAQTVAAGPYYATPSWDQSVPCAPGNCPRFVVLSNFDSKAVLDRDTGLVWERNPTEARGLSGPSQTWSNSTSLCVQSSTGGRKGWRLPFVHELATLYDTTAPLNTLALPAGHPFEGVAAGTYWSATQIASVDVGAYAVPLRGLFGVFGDDKTVSHFAWCVRGPASLPVH